MMLTKLILADICRDGGSYVADFETDNGLTYSIFLQCSKMPDADGLHHRWLFEYFGDNRPQGCLPVVTGSREEKGLLDRLQDFLGSGGTGKDGIKRVRQRASYGVSFLPLFAN
jgi:hypothetical protein